MSSRRLAQSIRLACVIALCLVRASGAAPQAASQKGHGPNAVTAEQSVEICRTMVEERIRAFHDQSVLPLSREIASYKEYLTIAVGIVGVVATILGWSIWSAQKKLRSLYRKQEREGTDALSRLAARSERDMAQRHKRHDLTIRCLRYVVEQIKSDPGRSEAEKTAVHEVYFALGLFAYDPREVRKSVKALAVRSMNNSSAEWLNEIRILWAQEFEDEQDTQRKQDIKGLIECIDESLETVLGNHGR
jgi:hypothetical protein